MRPLARLALITARPPLVLIRARKPWLRALFNTLGWNVLFISPYLINAPEQAGINEPAILLCHAGHVNRKNKSLYPLCIVDNFEK